MFELLFERSTDPIWLFDPQDGVFVDCNQAAVELMRCGTKETLLRTRPIDLSPPFQPDGRSSQEATAEILALVERKGGHRFEWVARRQDGEDVPLEVVSTQIAANGKSLHVVVSRDISERKRADAALRESEQLLSSIADHIAEAVYRTSPTHELVYVNRAYLRLFGYESLEEVRSFPRERLYANVIDRAQLLEQLARDGRFSREIEFVRKDGSRFWGFISSLAIRDPETGAVKFHVGTITDVTERKRAEEEIHRLNATLERRVAERTAELRASEARMRTLVEHAPEAIVVFDGDTGLFLSCNENACRLYGLSRDELLKRHPSDVSPLVQPDGRLSLDSAREKIQEALAGEAPVFEWVHKHTSGRLITCEVRLVRLPAEGRNLVRGSVIDNTERRRREKIQQATYEVSEAMHTAGDLERLYERIHTIVKGLMPAKNFYIALFDTATETISFPYFVDESDSTPRPFQLGTGLTSYVLRTGKPLLVDREMTARKRRVGDAVTFDGFEDIRYVESGTPAAIWLGVPLMFRGQIFGAMAVQDFYNDRAYGEEEKQLLTFVAAQTALAIERKRAEQALRESEAKFRALFEASSLGVMLHDEEKFLEVNPATLRIMGYQSPDELIGKHPIDTSPPTQPNGESSAVLARKHIVECMTKGNARFEWMARSAKGAEIPLEVILTRVEMGGRQIIQAVINDISERKKAETELLKALAREKELGELKSNFVSMVSHEFRTPLGVIMSSAEILRDYLEQLDGAEREQHLQSIAKSTRRMAELMEEVLVLGRLDAGKMDFKPAPLDLQVFCQRLTDEVLSATERQCPIELAFGPIPSKAHADERLLRHIFTNLLTNAVKYSEPGKPVQFHLDRDGTDVVCGVRDQGIGISEEDKHRLFDAFYRGRNVGQRPGTGLGLVIVKRCVELHGGRIAVESKIGEGTTVTVRVPVFGAAS